MGVKSKHNFRCARQLIACPTVQDALYSHTIGTIEPFARTYEQWSRQFRSREYSTARYLKINIEQEQEQSKPSLPVQIYVHSPLLGLKMKMKMLNLKLRWDFQFNETNFIQNSKLAIILMTDLIREKNTDHIKLGTTPMGYHQIEHDVLDMKHHWKAKVLRFEVPHIHRAIPLNLQMLQHYDHKFAFIDMMFVLLRRSDEFRYNFEYPRIMYDLDRARKFQQNKVKVEYPIVFAEIFARFRRDYSKPRYLISETWPTQWLISTFKIRTMKLLNEHPEVTTTKGNELEKSANSLDCI